MRIRNNLFSGGGIGSGGGGPNFQTPLGFSHNGSCYRQKSPLVGIHSNGGLSSGKNGFPNAMPYNIIATYTNNNVSNNDSTTGGNYIPHWRRNNFKPLHPDVIEQEGDDDAITLMAMHSTPPSEEISAGERRALTTTLSDEESSSCICEQELGSRTECDGTCILSEVSRVQAPTVASPLLLPLTTTTSTLSSDNNNFKLDFNYVDNARVDMEMSEYAPLHNDATAGEHLTTPS